MSGALAAGAGLLIAGHRRGALVEQRYADEVEILKTKIAKLEAESAAATVPSAAPAGFHPPNVYAGACVTVALLAFSARAMRKSAVAHREYLARSEAWQQILGIAHRKDLERERFGGEALAKLLVPLLDDGGAVAALSSKQQAGALRDALRLHGVEIFSPARGTPFDAQSMEEAADSSSEKLAVATAEVKAVGGGRSRVVAAVMRSGYIMHGERVLRAAQVKLEDDDDAEMPAVEVAAAEVLEVAEVPAMAKAAREVAAAKLTQDTATAPPANAVAAASNPAEEATRS